MEMLAAMAPERILVIRTGGLGDTLLMWPALTAVRRRFPNARIDLMGHRERCQLLAVPQGADLALDVEGSGLHVLFEISAAPPDSVRARFGTYDAVVAFAAPGDYALAENLSACGVEEVHAFLPYPTAGEAIHAAEHAKQSLIGVDLAAPGEDPLLGVSAKEREDGAQALLSLDLWKKKLALLAPGSGSASKNWPPQRFAELAMHLSKKGFTPVLLEGPADSSAVSAVLDCAGADRPPVLVDQSPATLKGVVSHVQLFVGNDAGPTHLAALMGVPTVAIFGPSDPVRWSPIGPRVALVRTGTECSPCTTDEMRACKERICLDAISVSTVLKACAG
jgi:ADP-heptose:LPS heptosyltransferase